MLGDEVDYGWSDDSHESDDERLDARTLRCLVPKQSKDGHASLKDGVRRAHTRCTQHAPSLQPPTSRLPAHFLPLHVRASTSRDSHSPCAVCGAGAKKASFHQGMR